jgi:hypothetical protein
MLLHNRPEGFVKLSADGSLGSNGLLSRVALGCSYRLSNGEGAQTLEPIIRRFQQVPTHSEAILDDTVQAEEPLGLTGRLEATHVPFPLPGRLMRNLE